MLINSVSLSAYTNQCIITPAMPGYPALGVHMANGEQGINSCRPAGTHLLHLG